MLRFQSGDTEAFDELVERNLAGVHSLAFRFLGNASMVEDIAQEAFLRVFRNAKNYQPRAKFTTWLYRIVANLCFNVSRSRKRGVPISLDAVKEDDASRDVPDTRQADPKIQLTHTELGEHIAKAVSELPAQQRMAFILHQYHQNSYAEIAEEMDTTPTAIKSLLSRGRANLRDQLGRYIKD
jgi:RNA polymerase sigma-70 factor (ECF subfamily)